MSKDVRWDVADRVKELLTRTDHGFTFEAIPDDIGGMHFNMAGSRCYYTKNQFDTVLTPDLVTNLANGVIRRLSRGLVSLEYSVSEHNRDLRQFFEGFAKDVFSEDELQKLNECIAGITSTLDTDEGRDMAYVHITRMHFVQALWEKEEKSTKKEVK